MKCHLKYLARTPANSNLDSDGASNVMAFVLLHAMAIKHDAKYGGKDNKVFVDS